MADTKCFGFYQGGSEKCVICEYLTSCQLFTRTEGRMSAPPSGLSFEEIPEFCEAFAVIPAVPEEQEEGARSVSFESFFPDNGQQMGQLLNYLFYLDDYTLGILAEIVAPSKNPSKPLNVSELARIHGISRQGMHRKLLSIARKSPELASLLKCVLMKVRRSRSDFHKHSRRKKAHPSKS